MMLENTHRFGEMFPTESRMLNACQSCSRIIIHDWILHDSPNCLSLELGTPVPVPSEEFHT